MTSVVAEQPFAAPPDRSLGRILDVARIAEWLGRELVWPSALSSPTVSLRRLWVGRGRKVSFELSLTPKRRATHGLLLLQGGMGDSPTTVPPSREAKLIGDRLGGVFLRDGGSGAWVCTPDRDPRLVALGDLLDPVALTRHVVGTRAFAWLHAEPELTSDLIAWRAGRRAMLRVRTCGPLGRRGVYIKTFRRLPADRTRAVLESLADHLTRASGGRIRVPPVLDVSDSPALVFTPEIEAAAPLTRCEHDLAAAAETLVWLHSAPIKPEVRHTPRAELQTVCRWLRALRPLQSAEYRRLRGPVRQLTRQMAGINGSGMAPVHRDYYHAQLLRAGDAVWLTDWDTLAGGHPEVDVATFGAHLALDALLDGRSPQAAGGVIADFVSRYRAARGSLDSDRMAFYLPSALLRLGALHGARGRPADLVHGMWDLAETALQSP